MDKKQLLFCVTNTVFAFILFLILQKSHILPGENSKLFFMGPWIKNLNASDTLDKTRKHLLFVNTSYDKTLVDADTDDTEGSLTESLNKRQTVITDREELTKFLEALNEVPNFKYVVCNIRFDHPSKADAALLAAMKKNKNLVVARGKDMEALLPGFRDLKELGLDVVYSPAGSFSKYRLFEVENNEVLKSIPLIMYEELYNTQLEHGVFFSKLSGNYVFNDFTPEYNIRKSDSLTIVDLGDIANFPKELRASLTDDSIVIIGDYVDNRIRTIYDQSMPAPLLLVNTFLSMEKGNHRIKFGLVITLIIIFLFFSYLVIAKQSKVESKIFKFPLIGGLIGGTAYALAITVISFLLYLMFDTNINLVYMGLFFYLENIVVNRHFHFLRIKKRYNLGNNAKK